MNWNFTDTYVVESTHYTDEPESVSICDSPKIGGSKCYVFYFLLSNIEKETFSPTCKQGEMSKLARQRG